MFPPVTLPCHMSMFHSAPSERHGITTNLYTLQVRPVNGLFEQIKLAGGVSTTFYGWEPLRDISRPGSLKFASYFNAYACDATDRILTDLALERIQQSKPDFVLPFWILIYLWGVPALLIPAERKKDTSSASETLYHPMLIATAAGMVIGLIGIPLLFFLNSAVSALGNCMSPVAMLLTGMTIAKINCRETFRNWSVYAVCTLRLLAIPLVFVVLFMVLPVKYGVRCARGSLI